jgi:hypothetical protein
MYSLFRFCEQGSGDSVLAIMFRRVFHTVVSETDLTGAVCTCTAWIIFLVALMVTVMVFSVISKKDEKEAFNKINIFFTLTAKRKDKYILTTDKNHFWHLFFWDGFQD